jgi:hypothetical protein
MNTPTQRAYRSSDFVFLKFTDGVFLCFFLDEELRARQEACLTDGLTQRIPDELSVRRVHAQREALSVPKTGICERICWAIFPSIFIPALGPALCALSDMLVHSIYSFFAAKGCLQNAPVGHLDLKDNETSNMPSGTCDSRTCNVQSDIGPFLPLLRTMSSCPL